MVFLFFILLLILTKQKQLQFNYNHSSKTILLFLQNGSSISFGLTFQHKDISIHQSLKNKTLFFSKQPKSNLENLAQYSNYGYKMKMSLKQNKKSQIMGSIGLAEGSQFYQLLKKELNATSVKIEVKHKEGIFRVVTQQCKYPIFLPIILTLSETNTRSYTVQHFSTNFKPDSHFLRVINKQKSPFSMSQEQTLQQLTISLRDRVISVPLTSLIECGKYSNSESFECEVQQNKESDVGALIFDFDPTFCGNAFEFDYQPESAWGYHYNHLLILILQFCLLSSLLRADRVKKIMNRALNVKFS